MSKSRHHNVETGVADKMSRLIIVIYTETGLQNVIRLQFQVVHFNLKWLYLFCTHLWQQETKIVGVMHKTFNFFFCKQNITHRDSSE